jgi:mannose-6-phosphate isomerase
MNLYPLRLEPYYSERPWGTRDLAPVYAKAPGTQPIGEVWLTGDQCRVANGPLAGETLLGLSRRFGRELVGQTAREQDRFPLLVKFLFPHDKLSVQVHPDDECARRLGQPCGKTECWYVLDAQPGARIGLGLKSGTTRAQFERAIAETRAEQLLNWVDVHPGELIYVEAGTVHTIGPGMVLVETQQNSDTTFRLYDYGRPRELHIRQGLEALKESTRAGKVQTRIVDGRLTSLISAPCFRVDKLTLRQGDEFRECSGGAAAHVLVGLNGSAVIECAGTGPLSLSRGEVVVIPASVHEFNLKGQWNAAVLRATVPSGEIREPAARL